MIALSIVIPVFNEEKMLPILFERLNSLLPGIREELLKLKIAKEGSEIEILFVNDGSTDNTRGILESIVCNHKNYRYVSLARNFGHQPAVTAGLRRAQGELVAIMDADMQDPPELLIEMVKKYAEGLDVVYAVRRSRKEGLLKNLSYKLYYAVNSIISDQPVQKNSGDFSLLSRRVVNILNALPEKEVYMRGLRAWVGFKQGAVAFDRDERKAGESKYSFHSLIKLAFRGTLSTSTKPLLLSGFFSIISLLIIIGVLLYAVLSRFFYPYNSIPAGWTSIMVTISVLSGFQLFSLWLLSLYLAKVYREVLSRPTFIIEKDSLIEEKSRHA